ncbi:hypothetical protein F4801DRAFT_588641 [Xylaria longipes]|nr:hypothetical protein F4801DRAFT_588641 [Xylaria longipes]
MATQHSNTARWQGDLLPHVVDRLASETPDDIYGLWPVGCASYKTRFREINYAQLANIVNGLAWWIVDQLDTSDGEQVLTYIGPNDCGCSDDIIVFLNGEKTNPVPLEQHIVAENHELRGVLVVGMTTADQAALIEHVWPSVEEANRAAPVHARVEKSLILVTSPDRPFIRSRKDTIQRQSSLARYTEDIDKLYRSAESASGTIYATNTQTALQITRALRRALHSPDFALSTIYRNPTVEQLTAAVLERNDKADEREMMELLLITYKGLIQQIPVPKSLNPVESDAIDVLLTGSTASLETLILQALLNRPDLAHPSLALDDAIYETLRTRVGLMIHNAWLVNFNLNLSAFRPHLARLVNLCQLSAAAAPRVLQLLSISSVGAVNGEALQGEAAPETLLEPFETPGPNGYSRSKFLSKLLCDAAAKNLGIPVTFMLLGSWNRAEWLPGLVISSLHLNCLSKDLGTQFSEVDWVSNSAEKETGFGTAVYNLRNPSTTTWDKLLPAIVEGASTKRQGQGCELDIVSPSVWVERLQQSMAAVTNDENSDVAAAAAANPAIKLFELYQNSLYRSNIVATRPMSVEQAVQASPTLRIMPSVCAEWTRKWVDEWLATA